VPFLDFPPDVRKVIYTTNAIESLNSSLRKLLHYRGHFPHDEAVFKLLYLALTNIEKKWDRSLRDWEQCPRPILDLFQRPYSGVTLINSAHHD
jgi:putative transposase